MSLWSQPVQAAYHEAIHHTDPVGIAVVRFLKHDVVRHPLVQKIVAAYDAHDSRRQEASRGAAAGRPQPAGVK